MKVFSKRYARDLYVPELQSLIDFGDYTETRGRKTLEFINVASVVEEPWHSCILLPQRHWNPWLAMSEALWILAGRDDVAALKPYNKNITSFSDDGVVLYGAYGARIFDQIDPLIERLRKDPSDRRAVLQIWEFEHLIKDPDTTMLRFDYDSDLTTDSKDPPCNDMVFFKLRENKLHMSVICRSNDIHWGLFAVNLPTFSILQQYIAARLGVGIGYQTHFSNSLHVYTDNEEAQKITDRMLYDIEEHVPYPDHTPVFVASDMTYITEHVDMADLCGKVLDWESDALVNNRSPEFLRFATVFLEQYRDHTWEPSALKEWYGQFGDWITAAQIFVDKVWKKQKVPLEG